MARATKVQAIPILIPRKFNRAALRIARTNHTIVYMYYMEAFMLSQKPQNSDSSDKLRDEHSNLVVKRERLEEFIESLQSKTKQIEAAGGKS